MRAILICEMSKARTVIYLGIISQLPLIFLRWKIPRTPPGMAERWTVPQAQTRSLEQKRREINYSYILNIFNIFRVGCPLTCHYIMYERTFYNQPAVCFINYEILAQWLTWYANFSRLCWHTCTCSLPKWKISLERNVFLKSWRK